MGIVGFVYARASSAPSTPLPPALLPFHWPEHPEPSMFGNNNIEHHEGWLGRYPPRRIPYTVRRASHRAQLPWQPSRWEPGGAPFLRRTAIEGRALAWPSARAVAMIRRPILFMVTFPVVLPSSYCTLLFRILNGL